MEKKGEEGFSTYVYEKKFFFDVNIKNSGKLGRENWKKGIGGPGGGGGGGVGTRDEHETKTTKKNYSQFQYKVKE